MSFPVTEGYVFLLIYYIDEFTSLVSVDSLPFLTSVTSSAYERSHFNNNNNNNAGWISLSVFFICLCSSNDNSKTTLTINFTVFEFSNRHVYVNPFRLSKAVN